MRFTSRRKTSHMVVQSFDELIVDLKLVEELNITVVAGQIFDALHARALYVYDLRVDIVKSLPWWMDFVRWTWTSFEEFDVEWACLRDGRYCVHVISNNNVEVVS